MVMRSVKTRTAARIMVERYREATEMLAENVGCSCLCLAVSLSFLFCFVLSLLVSFICSCSGRQVVWIFLLCVSFCLVLFVPSLPLFVALMYFECRVVGVDIPPPLSFFFFCLDVQCFVYKHASFHFCFRVYSIQTYDS